MIINIQLLRFAAAFIVCLFHFSGYYDVMSGSPKHEGALSFTRYFGISGVDIFFVISGFIIYQTAQRLDGSLSDSLSFAYKRVTRIYLGYWPFLLIMIALQWLTASQWLEKKNFIASIFLYYVPIRELILPVSWTLGYELYFYAAFSLLILFGAHHKKSLVIAGIAVIVLVNVYFGITQDLFTKGKFGTFSPAITFFASPLILEFLAGILLADYARKNNIKYPLILIFVGLLLILSGAMYNHMNPDTPLGHAYNIHCRVAFFGTAAVFLVAGMVGFEQNGKKFLPKFALIFGGASYALYLLHTIAYIALARSGAIYFVKTSIAKLPFGVEFSAIIILLSVIGLSAVIYWFIELPVYKKVKAVNPFVK